MEVHLMGYGSPNYKIKANFTASYMSTGVLKATPPPQYEIS